MPTLQTAYSRLKLEYNGSDLTLTDMERMLTRSAVVRYAYDYLRTNVAGRIGAYSHPDPAVEEWVNDRIMPAVTDAIPEMMSAIPYGCMLAEPIYTIGGDDIELARVHVALPDDWWSGKPTRDETGAVTGWRLVDGRQVDFESETGARQIVHWAYGSMFDSAWGDPVLRRAYPEEWTLRSLRMMEAVGAETTAIPRVLLRTHGSAVGEGQPGSVTDRIEQAGSNAIIEVPASEVQDITQLAGGFSSGSPFDEPIRRCVVGIFAAFYQPALIHTEAQYGTRAQASTAYEAWMRTETSIADELADDVILRQVILPALKLRFGAGLDQGAVIIRDAVPPDLQQWGGILSQLYMAQILDPRDPEVRRWAAEMFGLPVATEQAALPGETSPMDLLASLRSGGGL